MIRLRLIKSRLGTLRLWKTCISSQAVQCFVELKMAKKTKHKTKENERCPLCRKLIDYRFDPNHIASCLAQHRLQYCAICSRLISIDSVKQHMAMHESSTSTGRQADYIDLDEFRLAGAKKVLWKILPHGKNRLQAIIRYFDEIFRFSNKNNLVERQRLLHDVYELGAEEIYVGDDEFEGYVVFVFLSRDMAVLESPYYGNATYIIWGSWQQLSRLDKSTLLSQYNRKVVRIIHKEHWLSNLKASFR